MDFKSISYSLSLTFLFLLQFLGHSALGQIDKTGCKDHPLITRFPQSQIKWCETQNFSSYHVAVGKVSGYRKIDKWIDLEGKVTRLYYEYEGSATMSEVYQNYRNAIQRAGFSSLAQGFKPQRNVSKEVGGSSWIATAYIKNPVPTNSGVMLFHGTSSAGGKGYIAAKLERASGNVYVVVAVYQHTSTEVVVLVDIIEEEALEDGKIDVDPDYIAKQIEQFGTVSLYGIYFDFDKATIQQESGPALQAVAEYLKAEPSIKLYIIGHTDMKGSLPYNLGLSEKRAQAVVEALVTQHQIKRDRIEGKGVGPLSPKSTNRTEEGRRLNRRVELVEKR
ncbi:MAG: OmpA family protein [Saprospiraceae bacterium]|nr:OmpA family protein [Saprospiraceae bacterium]